MLPDPYNNIYEPVSGKTSCLLCRAGLPHRIPLYSCFAVAGFGVH